MGASKWRARAAASARRPCRMATANHPAAPIPRCIPRTGFAESVEERRGQPSARPPPLVAADEHESDARRRATATRWLWHCPYPVAKQPFKADCLPPPASPAPEPSGRAIYDPSLAVATALSSPPPPLRKLVAYPAALLAGLVDMPLQAAPRRAAACRGGWLLPRVQGRRGGMRVRPNIGLRVRLHRPSRQPGPHRCFPPCLCTQGPETCDAVMRWLRRGRWASLTAFPFAGPARHAVPRPAPTPTGAQGASPPDQS